jgi:hypothetical protein
VTAEAIVAIAARAATPELTSLTPKRKRIMTECIDSVLHHKSKKHINSAFFGNNYLHSERFL